jgi:hypothetical protein
VQIGRESSCTDRHCFLYFLTISNLVGEIWNPIEKQEKGHGNRRGIYFTFFLTFLMDPPFYSGIPGFSWFSSCKQPAHHLYHSVFFIAQQPLWYSRVRDVGLRFEADASALAQCDVFGLLAMGQGLLLSFTWTRLASCYACSQPVQERIHQRSFGLCSLYSTILFLSI